MSKQYISKSEQVAKKISDMIFVEKRYQENDRLPSENELADELNVSRTSLREAIKTLIANNILYIKRGVGTFVKGDIPSTIAPFDIFYPDSKKQTVRDAFEIRLVLGVEAAKLAAIRATEDDILEIKNAERDCANLIKAGLNYDEADRKFHRLIENATYNPLFNQISPLLDVTINTALHSSSNYKDIEKKLADNALYYHKEIVRLIKERDPNGAGFAMYCHVSKTSQTITDPIHLNKHD